MDLSITSTSTGGSDKTWLASDHGLSNALPRTLDVTKFVSGVHYDAATKVLKSGIAIAKITAGGLYGPYDTTATDGRQTAYDSFTAVEVPLLLANGATSAKVAVAVVRHAIINTPALPVAAQRAGGASDVTTGATSGDFVFES
ncbi:hypothetical protein ASF48_04970 [Rathayibacter sp. Leaf299]|uniref:head decoration protein n=1 Tax=unclassified Rathayibacter TaxID=2609250 RepID=UPI0006F46115|nr:MULTISPECIES: head decoration protein [unclassified Rathayibacter]KQQ22538.1 hypothetical protein ASF48_04970 [Rathayibacter sp. Leaf299]